ncbi:MAG: ATPase [Ignisphaera sp.]|uniref:ATPase n=2 Tax=Ignisphaera aggregans TaxID=334771 RepID=A0A832AVS4_9CREN
MYVAFLSGGKDSYYAVYRYGRKVDLGIVLVYEFPRPSPHLLNIGKSIETLLLAEIPVTVARLTRGREFMETVDLLKKLQVDVIVAGDVYVDEHLNYMEKLAKEVGATLVEPLWGLDPLDLLYRELNDGVKPLIIGCIESLSEWLGVELGKSNVDLFVEKALKIGVDPLGEKGEYHTVVLTGPLHRSTLGYKTIGSESYGSYIILRLI